jgi:DNA-directed RNA polymerase specialized sigma24 family protein
MTHGTRPPGLARPTAAPIAVVDYDGGGEDSRLRALALAAAHDGAAMTELVRATSSMLWRLCTALVDAASAEDLTQDTHARALRSLPSYRGDSSPRTWLATIARRVCADEIRRRHCYCELRWHRADGAH